jgi:hypothetical protein
MQRTIFKDASEVAKDSVDMSLFAAQPIQFDAARSPHWVRQRALGAMDPAKFGPPADGPIAMCTEWAPRGTLTSSDAATILADTKCKATVASATSKHTSPVMQDMSCQRISHSNPVRCHSKVHTVSRIRTCMWLVGLRSSWGDQKWDALFSLNCIPSMFLAQRNRWSLYNAK